MKQLTILLLLGASIASAQSHVDIYSQKDLRSRGDALQKKGNQFASEELTRYRNHYTMLAFREATGSAEVHQHEADIFVVEQGQATIVTGGEVINPHTEKAGEIRGTSLKGGERNALGIGDIIHIPAGTPHQLLVEKGNPFTYFVIKVTGQ